MKAPVRVRPLAGRDKILKTGPLRLPSDQDASGRTFGDEERAAIERVIASGTLVSTKGPEVKHFEAMFCSLLGSPHGIASSSGSAAVHAAVAAVDPEPGDEIVTTAITDMGAITPILYQGAIPVFADVDPATCNVTPTTIEAAITPRTRAVIVTHLFGRPCDLDGIAAVTRKHGVALIEDCAQAPLATSKGRNVGTIGDYGAFSFQQGKHITCGEGGLTLTNDAAAARRIYLWVNKGYGYGNEKPDHDFIALNGRMSEFQGAFLGAQLAKLEGVVNARRRTAHAMTEMLDGLEGVGLPRALPGDEHSYWKYSVTIDPGVIPGGPVRVAEALKVLGVASAPRYIQKPAFACTIFTEQRTFGSSRWPFTLARPEALDYSPERYPGTFAALETVLVLPWNEKYEERHVEFLGEAVRLAITSAKREAAR